MPEITPSRYVVNASWDDAPHLDERTKKELWDGTPPYLRDARAKGIPSLGAGAIYPVPESEILITPFMIPAFWKRCYGMDVGWKCTAVVWLAQDPLDGTLYAHSEYKRGKEVPVIHATAVKARGEWIPGAIDFAGSADGKGKTQIELYTGLGLKVVAANKEVTLGLDTVYQMLATGRLKLFTTMSQTIAEYRMYRRDENGKIVKENDHLLDALRYAVMKFNAIAKAKPADEMPGAPKPIANRKAGY